MMEENTTGLKVSKSKSSGSRLAAAKRGLRRLYTETLEDGVTQIYYYIDEKGKRVMITEEEYYAMQQEDKARFDHFVVTSPQSAGFRDEKKTYKTLELREFYYIGPDGKKVFCSQEEFERMKQE